MYNNAAGTMTYLCTNRPYILSNKSTINPAAYKDIVNKNITQLRYHNRNHREDCCTQRTTITIISNIQKHKQPQIRLGLKTQIVSVDCLLASHILCTFHTIYKRTLLCTFDDISQWHYDTVIEQNLISLLRRWPISDQFYLDRTNVQKSMCHKTSGQICA